MASRSRLVATLALLLLVAIGVGFAFQSSANPARDRPSSSSGTTPSGPSERAKATDRAGPAERHFSEGRWPNGPWTAAVGNQFVYDVRSASTFELEASAEGDRADKTEPTTLRWHARLVWSIHDRNQTHILASLRAETLGFDDLPSDDEDLAARVRAMESTNWLRMGLDGEVTGIRFAAGISSDGQDFLRNVVALLGYRVGDAAGGWRSDAEWTVEESDNTGRYVAAYRRLARRSSAESEVLERHKQRYVRVNQMLGEVPKHELSGSCTVHMNRTLGWLQSVNQDERAEMGLPGVDGQIHVQTKTTLRLVDRSTLATDDRVTWSELDADGFAPAGGEAADWSLDPQERLDELAAELGDRTLGELVDALRKAITQFGVESKEVYDLWASIGHLLEVRPEAAAELTALVRTEGGEGAVAEQLLSALGAAGNPEAQHQLVGLAGDPALKMEVRERAVVATHQIAEPAPELMDALFERVRSRREFDGLSSASVLALGTLSSRAVGGASGPGSDAKSPLQRLLDQEQRAIRGGWLDTWLESLGNSERPEVIPTLLRYAKHQDAGLRGIAARVLPRIADPRVVPALIERVKLEGEVAVRRGLADSLGECPSGPADVALRGMIKDSNELVVLHTIQALGRRLGDPANLAAVVEAERLGSTDKIRKLAKAALEAHRQAKK